jgi:hypothetical protein
MLPCNMIRSPQSGPATSSSLRRLPLPPFYCAYLPILCLSPHPTCPFSTHPSQLDTPVPSQPLCYQSHPHAFRHTGGCASVSASDFELSTAYRSFRKSPHQYHYHSAPLSRPLFSYSYALFCPQQNAIFYLFISLRTLCTKHPGWRIPPLSNTQTIEPRGIPKLVCARSAAPGIRAPLKNSWFGTTDDLSSLQDLGRFASVGRLRSWMARLAFGFRARRDHSSNLSRVRKGLLP